MLKNHKNCNNLHYSIHLKNNSIKYTRAHGHYKEICETHSSNAKECREIAV